MKYLKSAVIIAASAIFLASCSTVVTALLVNELLNDSAPKMHWRGKVTDSIGQPVGGVDVEVLGEVDGDTNIAKFSERTDAEGNYDVTFRWNSEVAYTIKVKNNDTVFFERKIGTVEREDQTLDIIIQASISTELSGVITGPDGEPLKGVLVIGASTDQLENDPVVLVDSDGDTRYEVTGDSGVYQLEGPVARYGVICAFHPDFGFAYASDEDLDSDGDIPLSVQMGATGDYEVSVQVKDVAGDPVESQILSADRQFRLRLGQPYNLSDAVDDVVSENGLFPGFVGEPSDLHPETVIISVQVTGVSGLAENMATVAGGNYMLTLLDIDSDAAATAIVEGSNTLVLSDDETVVVRVN